MHAWRQRRTPGASAIAVMMVAAAAWSFFYGLELAAVGLEAKLFWAKPQYFGICVIPLAVLAFGVRYTGRDLRTREWLLLSLLPLATLVLVFTNERHGLVWSSTTLDASGGFLALEHGPFFWVYWVYSYVLILVGLAAILSVFVHSGRLYRMQSGVLLLGLLAPWLSNSLYVLDILPLDARLDLTPAAFTLTGVALAWGLFRFRLLDVAPVARHNIVEGMRDGVVVLDSEDRIVDVNPAASPLLACPPSECFGMEAREAISRWSRLERSPGDRLEMSLGRPSRDYEVTQTSLDNGGKAGKIILLRDITERKKAERELVESEERYRRLVELSPDAIVVHSEGMVEYINDAGAKAIGASSPEQVIGRRVMDFVHPDYRDMVESRIEGIYNGKKATFTEEKFVRLDGAVIDVETSATPISNGGKPAAQLVFREITERKALEDELSRRAFHDTLTGLPNRTLFMELLEETLEESVSGEVGILFLDLDGFKLINDSLGHDFGDRLLVAAAGRLRSCVRPEDTVARMGGDEFTVLLRKVSGQQEAVRVAERISDSLKTPFSVEGHEIFVTTSIGIAVGSPAGFDAKRMLRAADTAMYEAKRESGSGYRVFEESMSEAAMEHLRLESDLVRALDHEEFEVFFQPVVSTETGRVHAFEALLRWNHPERGLLVPEDFMRVAEEAGLMPEIGGRALEDSLKQAGEWSEKDVALCVNLSARQLKEPDLADTVFRLLDENEIAPGKLEIEVTEDALAGGDSPALSNLERLAGSGVSLAIDDFGTGYSSLSQLKKIPFDTIKIDSSLVCGLDRGEASSDATIVSGIVKLAHALGKRTVAEGVETRAQLDALREMRCDFVQGNLLSPPLARESAPRLLEDLTGEPEEGSKVPEAAREENV